jgi:hypothetical protein
MVAVHSLRLALFACLLAGCGDGTADETTSPTEEPPDCAANELALSDGSCVGVGVPIDGCGDGFVHDGDAGCTPVLPAERCAHGLMAVPGEESCREVAPCGDPPWGDIPVDGDTQYLDAAYTGGVSDGTATQPWTSLQQAIDAAAAGAIVAIAEGRYGSGGQIEGKPVRLWGRCPALVEIGDVGTPLAAIDIRAGADGSELRDLSVVSGKAGILLSGSHDVLVDRVWVHDGGERAIGIQDSLGPSSMVVSRSLIEANQYLGVLNFSSTVTIDATVVRDTVPHVSGDFGMGVSAQDDLISHVPADLTITGSLIDHNAHVGVYVSDSQARIDSSVIRDTQRDAANEFGTGVQLETRYDATVPAGLTLERSLLERNFSHGVFSYGSVYVVRATVIRDTFLDEDGDFGRALGAQPGIDGTPSSMTVETSLVDLSRGTGVMVSSSFGAVSSTIVRNTVPLDDGTQGDSFAVYTFVDELGTLQLNHVLVEQSARSAVSNFAGVVSISSSRFLCQQFEFDGERIDELDYLFTDEGDNLCGCGAAAEPCKVVSSMLEPPSPVAAPTK